MTNGIGCLAAGVLLLSGCGPGQQSREVHVAAAANLRTVLQALVQAAESKHGIHIVPTIGATAQLTQQIENGAPIDLFLSADMQHVHSLIAQGLADPQSRAIYARGQLVLWAPSRPDIATLHDLASPTVKQVGCAKPELAPYGAAAIQALKKEGIWEAVEPKLVYGQSISVAKQFADSGNVAASFTALSLVTGEKGHYVVIDERLHDPIDQGLCIVKKTTQPESARELREFILSDEGRAIFARYGYTQP